MKKDLMKKDLMKKDLMKKDLMKKGLTNFTKATLRSMGGGLKALHYKTFFSVIFTDL